MLEFKRSLRRCCLAQSSNRALAVLACLLKVSRHAAGSPAAAVGRTTEGRRPCLVKESLLNCLRGAQLQRSVGAAGATLIVGEWSELPQPGQSTASPPISLCSLVLFHIPHCRAVCV